MRFNRVCPFDRCLRLREQDDVLCKRCYLGLPLELRRSLKVKDLHVLRGNIVLALTWLEEHRETDL